MRAHHFEEMAGPHNNYGHTSSELARILGYDHEIPENYCDEHPYTMCSCLDAELTEAISAHQLQEDNLFAEHSCFFSIAIEEEIPF